MPGLGRRHAPDPRDEKFPLRNLIKSPPAYPSRAWTLGPALDQGNTPHCVGYGWRNWMNADPIMDPPDQGESGDQLYDLAQQNDEFPGPPPAYDGSSVRGGAKAMLGLKRLGAYHWSQSADDVRDYILTLGPVVMGTNWSHSMFTPAADGTIKYDPSNIAGGHCYLLYAYNGKLGAFRGFNSWGAGWAVQGRFWLGGEDVQKLLADNGEACAGAEVTPAA